MSPGTPKHELNKFYLIPFEPGLLPWVDASGHAASLVVLTTFCINVMLQLRCIAVSSNVLFICSWYFEDFRLSHYLKNCCVLYATEPIFKRARFVMRTEILTEVLGGTNLIGWEALIRFCQRQRARIERAYQSAFKARPSTESELRTSDFGKLN